MGNTLDEQKGPIGPLKWTNVKHGRITLSDQSLIWSEELEGKDARNMLNLSNLVGELGFIDPRGLSD